MSVQELEKAVAALQEDELSQFAAWFDVYRQQQTFDAWDSQMAADAEAGKLDALIQQAVQEHHAGKTRPLP